MLTNRPRMLTAVTLVAVHALISMAPARDAAADAAGAFELVIKDSKALTPGTTKIRYQGAFASRVRGLVPGNAEGIEIVFVTRPITPAMMPDILQNDARELRKSDYAAFVLFLDKGDTVSQVNLSLVVPGTTVARTVAWKPDDLRKHFSAVTVRGGRVALKSKGAYAEVEAGHEALRLTWDVHVDLPLIRELAR